MRNPHLVVAVDAGGVIRNLPVGAPLPRARVENDGRIDVALDPLHFVALMGFRAWGAG